MPWPVYGAERLSPTQRELLNNAICWAALEPGTPAPFAADSPPSLVVIDDRGGLTELATRVQQDVTPPIVLYIGERPSVAVQCLRLGARDVLCLHDHQGTGQPDLAGLLLPLASSGTTAELSTPAEALHALPLALALRRADGSLHFQNPAHQRLSFARQAADRPADLDLDEVVDPASGRLFLRSHTPLPATADGRPALVLEVLEEITGRHSDQSEIARQRSHLARHAEALALANRELERLDRAKARFIALAAHEIRTPLTALTNAVHLLDPQSPSERHQRMLSMAERNLRRLAILAEDLLEFTKLDTGHAVLGTEPLDLHHCVEAALSETRSEAAAQGVNLSTPSQPLPHLCGDPQRMTLMLRTLLLHATRRAPEGSSVDLSITEAPVWQARHAPAEPTLPGRPDGWLEIRVNDRGSTLDAAVCEALFTGFGAGRDGFAGETHGAGLDLALCARVAAVHGGICWAEPMTTAGREGLTTVVRLPRLNEMTAPLLAVAERLQWLTHRQAEPCLLLIEGDDDTLSQLLEVVSDRQVMGDEAVGHPAPMFTRAGAGRLVGVVAGGATEARAMIAHMHQTLTCSSVGHLPIRGGWSTPEVSFERTLSRAGAVLAPLDQQPPGGQTGGT